MNAFQRVVLAAGICLASLPSAFGQANQQRGVALGGIAGAIAGGIIGDHNDEAGAGAAIGGVVGAVAGGILGNASDKEADLARQRAAYYHAHQQQAAAQQQAIVMQSAVTLQDVISMSRSGLSDQVIINQVRQRGFVGKVAVNDIIALHQQGVSENVITQLQAAGSNPAPVQLAQPAPQTPVVIERHYTRPAPVIIEERVLRHYPRPHYYHHPRGGYRFYRH
ncbi:glycine zipper domain-containing protein [Roseiconus lacunae]|uniref:Glycine zipper domain-containing protein n=1 Tax=Roseiconus lacunae TaxID=2605694 RepID=A0ABT7PF65_9BACT|nr:glycine zipper domain-containing protein [Roseiconus lacunae]MCD0462859.1 glycine zipper domain-containing protein [Roseiconus lacunae]MDM4014851.1 glycine zipper domain-containing protein [Roseiconus lacunae]WRQ50441.1 glycine zipper domain-containing protein [Stieleria sp. HD01]